MKVLFAVSDDKISEQIAKKYQQDYKEIISTKNVYYFNAIIRELQNDKSYDRIVISEDLEMYASDNYKEIDKFIFEKLDSISDEAVKNSGADIPIILICSDRRTKMDPIIIKFFGIGIYSALLGKDRSIQKVCDLIYKPRSKKEAKSYYRVESSDIEYKTEHTSNGVSETEIRNILMHYKKIGNNPAKCADSFRKISAQYTEEQIKLIIPFLSLETKTILEQNSREYLQIIGKEPVTSKKENKNNYVEKELTSTAKMSNPVIIPAQLKSKKAVSAQKTEERRLRQEAELRAKELREATERNAEKERIRMEKIKKQEEARARQEAARLAEEKRKKEEAAKKAEEERKRQEALRKAEEEKRRKEEAAKKAEEERKRQEAIRKAEEEKRRKEEAARKAEEERKRQEAIRKAEEEKRRKEEAARKAEEERKRQEALRKAEEEKRKKEEAARKAEEERKRQEALRKAEEEKRKKEEAARKAEEERKRQEALRKAEEEKRKKEEAAKKAEEERKKQEAIRKTEEKKMKEENVSEGVRKRGRPRKVVEPTEQVAEKPVKTSTGKRGRPRKNPEPDANVEKNKKEKAQEETKKIDVIDGFINVNVNQESNEIDTKKTKKNSKNKVEKDLLVEEILDDEELITLPAEDINLNDDLQAEDDFLDDDWDLESEDDFLDNEDWDDEELDSLPEEDDFELDSDEDFDLESEDDFLDDEDWDDEELDALPEEDDFELDSDEDFDLESEEDFLDDEDWDDEELDSLPEDDDFDLESEEDFLDDEDWDDEELDSLPEDDDFELDSDEDFDLESEEDFLDDEDWDDEELDALPEEDDFELDADEDFNLESEEDFLDDEDWDDEELDSLPEEEDFELDSDEDFNFEDDFLDDDWDDENLETLPKEDNVSEGNKLSSNPEPSMVLDEDDFLDEAWSDDDDDWAEDDWEDDEVEETVNFVAEPIGEITNPNYNANSINKEEITKLTAREEKIEEINQNKIASITRPITDLSVDSLITGDKKIVSFVGTTKNGTSFIVNNLAKMFSEKGIKTAVLDLTQNRNAYYIYTENEENLRKKAFVCLDNLKKGIADGIEVNKNLTVYTSLPGENTELSDKNSILQTLLGNYSLVLLDCDFETDPVYFKASQEMYLVQTFDVLTIQPLTAFLRDLKLKNMLEPDKLRIIINKNVKVSGVTEKILIGGMSVYNDPGMTYMTELFNRDKIKYVTVPFEEQIYKNYLESLIKCKINYKGSSKKFISSLNSLGNLVYPLITDNKSKKKKDSSYGGFKSNFSNETNETLNKMKESKK